MSEEYDFTLSMRAGDRCTVDEGNGKGTHYIRLKSGAIRIVRCRIFATEEDAVAAGMPPIPDLWPDDLMEQARRVVEARARRGLS